MGLPRYAAASMRSVIPSLPGRLRTQAARTSPKARGVHSGSTLLNADLSKPVAANDEDHSGIALDFAGSSFCGGTTSKSNKWPSISRNTKIIPLTSIGGPDGDKSAKPRELLESSLRISLGLRRYQKKMEAGSAVARFCQRFRPLSWSRI